MAEKTKLPPAEQGRKGGEEQVEFERRVAGLIKDMEDIEKTMLANEGDSEVLRYSLETSADISVVVEAAAQKIGWYIRPMRSGSKKGSAYDFSLISPTQFALRRRGQ